MEKPLPQKQRLSEAIRGYAEAVHLEEIPKKKMLELRESLLAVEEDRAMGRHGISLDELDRRLGAVLGEVK